MENTVLNSIVRAKSLNKITVTLTITVSLTHSFSQTCTNHQVIGLFYYFCLSMFFFVRYASFNAHDFVIVLQYRNTTTARWLGHGCKTLNVNETIVVNVIKLGFYLIKLHCKNISYALFYFKLRSSAVERARSRWEQFSFA